MLSKLAVFEENLEIWLIKYNSFSEFVATASGLLFAFKTAKNNIVRFKTKLRFETKIWFSGFCKFSMTLFHHFPKIKS